MSTVRHLSPPDHALDAEMVLLAHLILEPGDWPKLGLRVDDFFHQPHRRILDAVQALHERGDPVDAVAIAEYARGAGTLHDLGGTVAIARVFDAPHADPADLAHHARTVREAAQVRRLDAAVAQLRVRCREPIPDRAALLADARRLVEEATDGATPAGRGLPVVDVAEVPEEVAPRAFVVERLHLAPGRPACLVGYAGAGKTLLAADLALAVAAPEDSGVTFWGGLVPDRRGRVLLLDFEVGRELTERRLLRLATGRWAKLRDWSGRLAYSSFPRWSLVAPRAEERLVETLRGHVLCVIDSLTAITPGVDENGKEMADAMALLTRASEATGCAILVLHHEGKPPADGPRAVHLRGRGHSSIQGIWSSQWAVTSLGEGRLRLEHGKTQEEGGLRPDVHCQICDTYDGEGRRVGVRLAPLGVEETDPGASPVAPGALARVRGYVLAILATTPGLSSKELHEEIRRRGPAATDTRYRAVDELVREGAVVVGREGKALVYRLSGTITSPTGNRPGDDGENGGSR